MRLVVFLTCGTFALLSAGKEDDAQSVATTVQADPQHHQYRDTTTVDGDHTAGHSSSNTAHTANNTEGSLSANDNIALLRATSAGTLQLQGKVSLSVYTLSPQHCMCGWLLKKSDSWVFGGAFRPYYFVLMNGELQYFQQAKKSTVLTLDQPKKLLFCANITAVEVKNDTICVSFKQNKSRGVWKLRVIESSSDDKGAAIAASPTSTAHSSPTNATTATAASNIVAALAPCSGAVQRMWVRKLVRCVPGLEDPDLRAAASVGLFPESGECLLCFILLLF